MVCAVCSKKIPLKWHGRSEGLHRWSLGPCPEAILSRCQGVNDTGFQLIKSGRAGAWIGVVDPKASESTSLSSDACETRCPTVHHVHAGITDKASTLLPTSRPQDNPGQSGKGLDFIRARVSRPTAEKQVLTTILFHNFAHIVSDVQTCVCWHDMKEPQGKQHVIHQLHHLLERVWPSVSTWFDTTTSAIQFAKGSTPTAPSAWFLETRYAYRRNKYTCDANCMEHEWISALAVESRLWFVTRSVSSCSGEAVPTFTTVSMPRARHVRRTQRVLKVVPSLSTIMSYTPTFLGGCFKTFFIFTPILGKIPILTNIFQMGWNHQPHLVWVEVALGYEFVSRPGSIEPLGYNFPNGQTAKLPGETSTTNSGNSASKNRKCAPSLPSNQFHRLPFIGCQLLTAIPFSWSICSVSIWKPNIQTSNKIWKQIRMPLFYKATAAAPWIRPQNPTNSSFARQGVPGNIYDGMGTTWSTNQEL